ncbi:MAG: type I 3-dehydroquinate dehydratase [Bacteroidota bacterium]
MICLSISSREQLLNIPEGSQYMLELRFDLIGEDPGQILPLTRSSAGVIATCRPDKLSGDEQVRILGQAAAEGVDYLDIELDAPDAQRERLLQLGRKYHTGLIISWHDFEKTPDTQRLLELLNECYHYGADVAKIACMVRSPEDAARLLGLYQYPGKKVVLGMGDLGRITRIAAPLLGAPFTFASPDQHGATAPGQMTPGDMEIVQSYLSAQ